MDVISELRMPIFIASSIMARLRLPMGVVLSTWEKSLDSSSSVSAGTGAGRT